MANNSPDTDGDIVYHRRGCALTLEMMLASAYTRRCVLPFLTGAPKAVRILIQVLRVVGPMCASVYLTQILCLGGSSKMQLVMRSYSCSSG
jgi:hypothetical protein